MVEPVTWHPAADRATREALVVEQDRSVVPLSTWLADAAVEAATTERVLQVLTPAHSRITYPMELLLRDSGGQWVVREARERFRDGLNGFQLRWSGARFVTDLDARPPDPADPQPGSGDLEVQISTLHQATESLELGASTVALFQALTGAPPAGFGIAEPITQPWSPREVTTFCRDRAPEPSQLVVTGGGVLGQLYVTRVDTGVNERIRVSGPEAGTVDLSVIERLAAEVAGYARSMIVAAHPGRLGGLRSSAPTLPALPFGILVGHQVLGRDPGRAQTVSGVPATLLGPPTRQAAWYRLDTGPGRPYEALTAVLQHFGLANNSTG